MFQHPLLSKAKHIAFIGQKGIPAEFAGTSGVEFYVEHHAKELVKQGKRVDCYVRNWATPKRLNEYDGIKLIHVPTINTKHLDAAVHSLLSSLRASFSEADTVWYQAIGPAAFSFIPKMFGKKIIVTSHALDWKREKWGLFAKKVLKFSERIAVSCADTLVVVSNDLREYYLKQYNKQTVVDLPSFERKPTVRPDIIIKKYGLKGNDYILYMGRFVPEKRIDWLIEAYKEIHPKGIKLVLSGGSSHSDKYEKQLYEMAKNNNSIVFTGYVFGKEKRELLRNCKLFVLPSSVEGNPTVLNELPKTISVIIADNSSAFSRTKQNIFPFQHNSRQLFIRALEIRVKSYQPDNENA